MQKYVEQESLPPKPKLQDPPLRNSLAFAKTKVKTEIPEALQVSWPDITGNPTDNADLVAALANLQVALGYTPLNPHLNLADVDDAELARTNLGLVALGSGDIWLLKIGGQMTGRILLDPDEPVQFQPGSLPTAELGMMDFDGQQLYFVNAERRRPFSFMSDGISSSAIVANTVTETDLWSAIIDENSLNIKQIFRALICGRYSNTDGTSTFTLRFKVAGTTVLSITSTAAAATNAPVVAEFINTMRVVGASGTFWAFVRAAINNVGKDKPGTATASVDTTAEIELKVTIEWSAADAGNTFSLDQALLNLN